MAGPGSPLHGPASTSLVSERAAVGAEYRLLWEHLLNQEVGQPEPPQDLSSSPWFRRIWGETPARKVQSAMATAHPQDQLQDIG